MRFNSPKTVAERKLVKCLYRLGAKIDPSIKFIVDDLEPTSADPMTKTVFINPFDVFNILDDEDILLQVNKEKGLVFDVMTPTFLVLHEIGHIIEKTKFLNYRSVQRQYFNQVDNLIKKNYDKLNEMRVYKSFKVEDLADRFAFELFKKHTCDIKKFDDEIREILRSL